MAPTPVRGCGRACAHYGIGMLTRTRLLAIALATAMLGSTAACNVPKPEATERWTTTENTNVAIDWDKVNEAYKAADGPADLERRVNEIYGGSEVISISVHDVDDKTQVVTGFFDRDTDGKVADGEKIFTIQRSITGEGQGQYQTTGYGSYAGYHSPMMSIMTGMMVGSMMSSMFSPRYVPMYSQPYTTAPARHAELRTQRTSYRAANPGRFARPSQTGRSYGGSKRTRTSPGFSRGGSRFGHPSRAGARHLAA
jgi:hypothetical protein